jgi:hypothetical protein
MPHRDPQNYSFVTYAWVFAMAMLGGVAHNIKKLKDGTLARFSLSELVGDLIISGFLGVVTFFLCEYAELEPILTAAIVGMSAHQGTRGIYFIEELIARRLKIDLKKDEK